MTFNCNEPQSSLGTQDCCLEVTSQHLLGPYGNNNMWLKILITACFCSPRFPRNGHKINSGLSGVSWIRYEGYSHLCMSMKSMPLLPIEKGNSLNYFQS